MAKETMSEKVERIRREFQLRLAARREADSADPVGRPPRYDEVYARGVAWLNSLDGEPLPEDVSLTVELSAEDSKASRVRLTLELSAELNETLEQLSEHLDCSKSQVLRRSIALMRLAVEARKQGKRIGIAHEGQALATEVVGI